MKLALSAMFFAALAGHAQAKPWNGADCVATSDTDLNGTSLTASHTDDAGTSTNTLSFEPKSFFVADGFAVKLFTGENFTGVSELDGGALTVNNLKKTDGGHYVNVGSQYVQQVKSFACVTAGKAWADVPAFHSRDADLDRPTAVAYFPGQVFGGNQGYHGENATISVDEKDGHKIVNFSTSFYYANGATGTVDLDTGLVTYSVTQGAWPHSVLSTQVIKPTAGIKGIDFQYKGVMDSVIAILDLVIKNPTTKSPAGDHVNVPNLELKSLRDALINGTY